MPDSPGDSIRNLIDKMKGSEKKITKINDFDFDSPFLDGALKKITLDYKDIAGVVGWAEKIKNKHPEKYKKEYEPKVAAYYDAVLALAEKDFNLTANPSMDSYRAYVKQLHFLGFLKNFIKRDIQADLSRRISLVELKLRDNLQSNPENIDKFLSDSYAGAADRELSTPETKKVEDKTLELLSVSNSKIKRIKNEKQDYIFKIEYGDEEWQFSLFFQYGSDIDTALIAVKSLKNPQKLIVLPFRNAVAYLEKDEFSTIANMAERNYKQETESSALLKKFDLPKSGKIEYIRLFGERFDPVTTPTFLGSTFFAEKLKQSYPNLQISSPIEEANPKDALRRKVEESYAAGTRNFFVDMYAHGTERKLLFPTNTGMSEIGADDLTAISKSFPDANFYFSTIGCFGGGMREGFLQAMERDPSLKDRISLFLQTKPDVPNTIQSRVLNKSSEKLDVKPGEITIYQMVLLKSLSKGKTFGEAVKDADEESKKRLLVDPETIINGQLITEKDQKNDSQLMS